MLELAKFDKEIAIGVIAKHSFDVLRVVVFFVLFFFSLKVTQN